MSFLSWLRTKKTGTVAESANLDDELDRLQTQLEEELLEDHVSTVHARSLSRPGLNAAIEIERESKPPFIPQTQHLFEYHSVFHRHLWSKTSDMSPFERETVADYLDILANNAGYRGLYLGSRELLEIAAHLREPGLQTSMLVEPWMSPFKLRRRDVRDLYLHLCKQATELFSQPGGPDDIRARWQEEVEAAKSTVGQFDLKAFGRLKSAVESVSLSEHNLMAASLYMNMDYVLACCGDRGAMSRMAGYMDFLVRNDPFVSTRLDGDSDEDGVRRVIGRSWMRLSACVAATGHDPYTTASEWLPNIWLDLRYIDGSGANSAEARGLLIPSIGLEADSKPFARRGWRDDRFGELKSTATGSRPSLSGDEDRRILEERIAKAMEVLRSFGTQAGSTEEMEGAGPGTGAASRDDAVIAALAEIESSGFGDDPAGERSREIARAFRRTFHSSSLQTEGIKDGTTAKLIDRLLTRGATAEADPEIVVLDSIGTSEAVRSESRPEETYARLLSPMRLVTADESPDAVYEALQSEFPWMMAANREVAVAVARSERQKVRHWRMQPTLLLGPPGVGKTRWIRRVSELTGVPTHTISLSGVSNSKSIIGSERGWASARPSFMAYGFMSTQVANPIFHVDELDKAGAGNADTGVQDSLLPILESETARGYPDIYLLGKLDLRWSTFLFSANDLGKVSPEVVTRLKVIHIRRPSHAEVARIIPSMIAEAASNENFDDGEIKDMVADMEANAMKTYVESGDLRDVQRRVEENINGLIWKPKGPRLVTS